LVGWLVLVGWCAIGIGHRLLVFCATVWFHAVQRKRLVFLHPLT